MDVGMMWFDNSKVPLDAKLLKAAEYYARKYGRQPDTAFVSLKELGAEQVRTGGGVLVESNGIRVDAMQAIMPGHLWIGVEKG
jgi:hypothetical protein